jgi:hypothetical protein
MRSGKVFGEQTGRFGGVGLADGTWRAQRQPPIAEVTVKAHLIECALGLRVREIAGRACAQRQATRFANRLFQSHQRPVLGRVNRRMYVEACGAREHVLRARALACAANGGRPSPRRPSQTECDAVAIIASFTQNAVHTVRERGSYKRPILPSR